MKIYITDLELYPMTLILNLDLVIAKMHVQTKNEISISSSSKVKAQTGRQTGRPE